MPIPALLVSALASLSGSDPVDPAAIDVGDRVQPMVDRHLVGSMDGTELRLTRPRDEGVVFRFDRPWEGLFCGYSTVIHDGDRFLLYYRGLPVAGKDGTDREVTCVATSRDGIEWTRPAIDRFEVDGTRRNNVVLADAAPVTHNFSPFLDSRPGVPADERFKALGGSEHSGLVAYVSADGLEWRRLRDEPVLTDGMFDSQNVACWSEAEKCYVSYFRTWTGDGYSGFRTVSRATSPDFVNWSETVPMRFGDGPMEHLYTNQTHPYFRNPEIGIAIAARFMPGRQVVGTEEAKALGVDPGYFRDCSDAVLLTTRGGDLYDRTFREGFLRPGLGLENWVSRSNYPALGVVQTGPAEMSVYMNADYAQPSAHLRRFSMRLDGFASMHAGAGGGSWTTKPLTFAGDRLELNLATSAAGEIMVEVQDADGIPIEGFAFGDVVPAIGNEISKVVRWKGDPGLGDLAGRPIRLAFRMRDADLFAFRFAADRPAPAGR
ncbi:MAG: hypothetical protein VX726_12290 [Planctomycetota bacterium]|nr:hypothetical protein [Planctomycetota bacterium]